METLKSEFGGTTLEPGCAYRIQHKRKGRFIAKVLAIEPTKPGDPDPYFIRVEINTSEGSPYAWMANAVTYIAGKKTTPPITEKLLRPSLISAAEKV